MTKIQTKQVELAKCVAKLGNLAGVARMLSAEIRMARRDADKAQIFAAALALGVTQHPDFII